MPLVRVSGSMQPPHTQSGAASAVQASPFGAAAVSQPAQAPMTGAPGMMQGTPFGGPMLMTGPPSQVTRVFGILVAIWGGLSLLLTLISLAIVVPLADDLRFEGLTGAGVWINAVAAVLASILTLTGGVMMARYQRTGVWIALGGVGVNFVGGVISSLMVPTEIAGSEIATAFGIGIELICGLICGVLIAVPLMTANHGLR